jgi:hypothetical protein
VTESDKLYGLLQYGIDYSCEMLKVQAPRFSTLLINTLKCELYKFFKFKNSALGYKASSPGPVLLKFLLL